LQTDKQDISTTSSLGEVANTPNPDAMDLYFQGMSLVNKGFAPTNMSPARNYFDRALEIDPDNVDALVGSAIVDTFFGAAFPSDDAAEAALTKALLLAPDHPMAHLCMGDVFDVTDRAGQAIGEFERALALDRNFAAAHAHMALQKSWLAAPKKRKPTSAKPFALALATHTRPLPQRSSWAASATRPIRRTPEAENNGV
jgi:Tfp pilus assembly protein PilF